MVVSLRNIVDFVIEAKAWGVKQVTIGGGDPLSRGDIVELIQALKKLELNINLDTVGTAFIDSATTIYYGVKSVPRIDPRLFEGLIQYLGIPIDGPTTSIAQRFRAGRPRLIEEQLEILSLLETTGLQVSINTVVGAHNIEVLREIFELIKPFNCVKRWQLFQFMPIGPAGFRNRERLEVSDEDFSKSIFDLEKIVESYNSSSPIKIQFDPKSRSKRKNLYLLVDDNGTAWIPRQSRSRDWGNFDTTSNRVVIGSILAKNNCGRILTQAFGVCADLYDSSGVVDVPSICSPNADS